MDEFLGLKEAASFSGRSESTLKRLIVRVLDEHRHDQSTSWESCKATAAKLRKNYQRGLDVFMYYCIKPSVCPSYFRRMMRWLPPEYAKKPGEFTAFMAMWKEGDKTTNMCGADDCRELAEASDKNRSQDDADKYERTFLFHCVKDCSQKKGDWLAKEPLLTQWQVYYGIFCHNLP